VKLVLKIAGGLVLASALAVTLAACGNEDAERAKAAAEKAAALQTQVTTLEEQVASLEADVASERSRADAAESALAENEAGIADAEAALATREADVKTAEKAVGKREKAVAKREKAVGKTEQTIKDSMLEPGTYLVPEEVSAGRYRTVNDITSCYMSQDKGSDIINNLLEEAGRPVFTVVDSPGSTFTIDPDCGTVEKID
jgi:hypothetical protein